ncbi:MAG: hypothetical protein IJV89_08460 [Lentisphaeria bacterium]|nr:hypothetical protein [Lentisphaeria bacterium]
MKQQECSHFLEEILTGQKPLSLEAAEHVKNCAECAALRESLECFTGNTALPEVPETLDRAVLEYAGTARRRRNFHQLFFRRIMPFAAAAAAAVVCVIALLPEADPVSPREFGADLTVAAAKSVKEWNVLESEACDLHYELMSCQQILTADWHGTM